MGEGSEHEPVIDYVRAPQPGPVPVPGAQWDELHNRWEVWDEPGQMWLAVDPATGELSVPDDELPVPPALLARAFAPPEDTDPIEDHVIDIDRLAAPPQPVPGAQWNEVVGRWEMWDDAAGAWVEALTDA